MNNISENIYKSCRVLAGLTQETASEKLNIAARTIRGYENGGNVPEDIVNKMAEIYKVPVLPIRHLKKVSPLGRWLPDIQEIQDLNHFGIFTVLAKDEAAKAEIIVKKMLNNGYTVKDIVACESCINSALSKLFSLSLYIKKI